MWLFRVPNSLSTRSEITECYDEMSYKNDNMEYKMIILPFIIHNLLLLIIFVLSTS